MSKTKKTIIALVAIFGVTVTTPALANGNPGETSKTEVKYLGQLEENPVFQLSLQNESGDNFIVRILDVNGSVLFTEKLEGKNITRNYRIATQDVIENGGLRFEIKAVNTKKTEVYSVGFNESFSRYMEINKIK